MNEQRPQSYFTIVIDLLPFQIIGYVHFALLVNAMMTSSPWMPQAYMFYNMLFMISLIWSIHSRESADAIYTVSKTFQLELKESLIEFDFRPPQSTSRRSSSTW